MRTTRRKFLTLAGKGILLTSSAALLNACGSALRENMTESNKFESPNKLSNRKYYDILKYASYAPSGHNTQPWKVKIPEKDRWIIQIDLDRCLPNVDPQNEETLISIGAFLENLIIASNNYGFNVDINYKPDSINNDVAELVLSECRENRYPIHKLKERMTVRKNHIKKSLRSSDLNYITNSDNEYFSYYDFSSAEGKYLAEGTLEANKKQIFRDDAQKELSEWIRWSESDAEKYLDGLTPSSMGITGIASLYVSLFYDKDTVMEKSFRSKSVKLIEQNLKSFGGWIIVIGNGKKKADLVQTGRRLQRMLLNTRDKQIAVHPMMQLLEEGFRKQVQSELKIYKPIQLILRTSYLNDYPDPVSLRRPVERFII